MVYANYTCIGCEFWELYLPVNAKRTVCLPGVHPVCCFMTWVPVFSVECNVRLWRCLCWYRVGTAFDGTRAGNSTAVGNTVVHHNSCLTSYQGFIFENNRTGER